MESELIHSSLFTLQNIRGQRVEEEEEKEEEEEEDEEEEGN